MRTLILFIALLWAVPAWAQPNRLADVERVAAADAARFACAHTDRSCAYDFIRALVCEIRKDDQRWGMNGRRGDPHAPSWDAIAYCGIGPATDPTGRCTSRLTIVDVIVGAGGNDPRPSWQAFVSDPTPGAWLVPECGGGGAGGGGGGTPQPVELAAVLAKLDALQGQVGALADLVARLGLTLDGVQATAGDVLTRVDAAQQALAEIAARPVLQGWPEYRGRVLGAPVTLRPQ